MHTYTNTHTHIPLPAVNLISCFFTHLYTLTPFITPPHTLTHSKSGVKTWKGFMLGVCEGCVCVEQADIALQAAGTGKAEETGAVLNVFTPLGEGGGGCLGLYIEMCDERYPVFVP